MQNIWTKRISYSGWNVCMLIKDILKKKVKKNKHYYWLYISYHWHNVFKQRTQTLKRNKAAESKDAKLVRFLQNLRVFEQLQDSKIRHLNPLNINNLKLQHFWTSVPLRTFFRLTSFVLWLKANVKFLLERG